MQKITENIYYVGVNDRNKSLFEGLWPLPNGVSYNSYLIDDEGGTRSLHMLTVIDRNGNSHRVLGWR